MFYPSLWLVFYRLSDIWKLEISFYEKKQKKSSFFFFHIRASWARIIDLKNKNNLSYLFEVQYFHKWNVYVFMTMFLGSLFCFLWCVCLFSPPTHSDCRCVISSCPVVFLCFAFSTFLFLRLFSFTVVSTVVYPVSYKFYNYVDL